MTKTNETGEMRTGAAAPNADVYKSDAQPVYPHTMRLQRFLARAGVASRRGSEDLMTAGRVTVNGQVAIGQATVNECLVGLVDVLAGVQQVLRQVTVGGKEQEARGVAVQTTHREEPRKAVAGN